MAAKSLEFLTLADIAKTLKTDIGDVAEVLLKNAPILKDIKYTECNKMTSHVTQIRSELAKVYYRKANQPIPASKSTVEDREFVTAHFESKSQIDVAVAKRGGADRVAFNRWNQAEGHLQGMANELADLIIYGSPSGDERKVVGFMDIYNTLSGEIGKQVIDAGGTGSDNASILFATWSPQTTFGIYEAGSTAGISREDKGIRQVIGITETGSTGTYDAWEEQFMCDHGIAFKDYRANARVANIDVSDLKTSNAADILDKMTDAHFKIPSAIRAAGGRVIYMNSTLYAFLYKQVNSKVGAGGGLTYANYQGEEILHFLGAPVKEQDNMLNTEARVVA